MPRENEYFFLFMYKRKLYHLILFQMDSEMVVSEFELYSRYYVHFRIYTFEKGMNLFILRQ